MTNKEVETILRLSAHSHFYRFSAKLNSKSPQPDRGQRRPLRKPLPIKVIIERVVNAKEFDAVCMSNS